MVKEELYGGLDPELWKQLPQDLLERVIWKLPFSSVLIFRAVSKHWYSNLIPRAAPHVQGSSSGPPVLLYFGHHENRAESSAWWMQVGNQDGEFQEFQPSSFPHPREGEYIQLLVSEGGLLFFGFIHKESKMVRDIVACNPLTAKSRHLGLPFPLGPYGARHQRITNTILIGVVFDFATESYKLVAAGTDELGLHPTLLYDSSTCLWANVAGSEINGTYMLLETVEKYEDEEDLVVKSYRSVCCNGNLYWFTFASTFPGDVLSAVVKFEIATRIWTLIPIDPRVMGCAEALCFSHIAAHDGKVLLWHIHDEPDYDENSVRGPPFLMRYAYCHVRDSERSNIERQLRPDLTLMSQDVIDRLERFLHNSIEASPLRSYFGFIHQDVLHHVVTLDWEMKIVQQNICDNSITQLPLLSRKRLPRGHSMLPENVWGFSASFTAVP